MVKKISGVRRKSTLTKSDKKTMSAWSRGKNGMERTIFYWKNGKVVNQRKEYY